MCKQATVNVICKEGVAYVKPGASKTGSHRSRIVTAQTKTVEPYIATSQAAAMTDKIGLALE